MANEHNINAVNIKTVYKNNRPFRLTIQYYKFKSFHHVLKYDLILMEGSGVFIIPISIAKNRFFKT